MSERASTCTLGSCGCTLEAEALTDRKQYIQQKIAPHVVNITRSPNSIVVGFAEAVARSDLEELVQLERQCCGFLSYRLDLDGVPELTIAGEDGGLDMLDIWVASLSDIRAKEAS